MIKTVIATLFFFMPFAIAFADDTYSKQIKYEVSLNYTLLMGKDWWSKIGDYNLYLGGLPLKNKGHFQNIQALGVTKVISLVEDFELNDGWWHKPVKAADWNEIGVETVQIPAVDFRPLTKEQLRTGIETLSRMLADGHTVYIHCKAGVGRSATIVVAYLIQSLGLTLDEAIAYVKCYRPHINLNVRQRKAIADYFNLEFEDSEETIYLDDSYISKASDLTEQQLNKLLTQMLDYVIKGGDLESNEYPDFMAGWGPSIHIESTYSRRDRYLNVHGGDADKAVQAAIDNNHSLYRKWSGKILSLIPVIGAPTNYTVILWHQLREIALIAALYGHEFDEQTRIKMLYALALGNGAKIPASGMDFVVKALIKQIAMQAGLKSITGSTLPAHLLFNYFTDNAAKVSTHAISIFGGENRKDLKNY